MEFEVALEQELKSISELQNRIYPLDAPEATKHNGVPYLIYASSQGLYDKTLDGYMDSKEVRGELNIITARYKEMRAITKKVVALLMGLEGRSIGTGGPYIEELIYHMPVELYESQPKLYRCVVEFQVFYEEVDSE